MVVASAGSVIEGVVAALFVLWLIGGVIYGLILLVRWASGRAGGTAFPPALRPSLARRTPEEKAQQKEERAYQKAVRAVQAAHLKAVREAEKGLKKATKEHEKNVRVHQKQLERVMTPPPVHKVSSAKGWAKLFEEHVETSKGSRPLTSSLQAAVDTTGNLAIGGRSTLTRMGTGAVLAGPLGLMVGMAAKKDKKVDARELYLILQDESWGAVIPFSPDRGEALREFAMNVNLAATNAPERARRQAERVQAAERALRQAKGNTKAITRAQEKLENVKNEVLALPPAPSTTPGSLQQAAS